MSSEGNNQHRGRRVAGRRTHTIRVALLLLAVGGGATACGGSTHSTDVPTAGRSATTSPSGITGPPGTGLLAYSACMRAHGVPGFPDPSGDGGVPKPAVVRALEAVGDTRAQAATNACNDLLPVGRLGGPSDPVLTPQQQQDYLNAAACMRSHGFADFPDPTFSDGHLSLSIPPTINTSSAQFTLAAKTCTKLIPTGLPDSHIGG